MASCLTLFIPSWNKRAVILDSVFHGHGQLPDRDRAESKNNNTRQNYCGDGQLPDLVCSQLEQKSSNSIQSFNGHGQLPDRECYEPEKGWREYSKAELNRVRKRKICTRVGATSSSFIWSRNVLHLSSDMQANQQVQQ